MLSKDPLYHIAKNNIFFYILELCAVVAVVSVQNCQQVVWKENPRTNVVKQVVLSPSSQKTKILSQRSSFILQEKTLVIFILRQVFKLCLHSVVLLDFWKKIVPSFLGKSYSIGSMSKTICFDQNFATR